VHWLWHQEFEWVVVLLLMMGNWGLMLLGFMMSEWEKEIPVSTFLMVSWYWYLLCFVVVLGGWESPVGWFEEIVYFTLEFLNWCNEIGPSHLEFIHMVVRDGLVKLLHFVPEGLFLNVSSSDRFIPFVVKSIDLGRDISNVDHESVDFSHLFHIREASIIDNSE